MKKIFISHPYKENPIENMIDADIIVREILNHYDNVVPISPLHLFNFFKEETPQLRKEIMGVCYHLIDICDEVWVFGNSKGCKSESEYAKKQGKEVKEKYLGLFHKDLE